MAEAGPVSASRACTLAGLVAMGACARIASARMVTVLDAAEREAAQDKTDGRGTR